MRHVVVVGASLAGISTARALRAQGYDGTLTLVGAEPHRPYDRPPLSKEFLAATVEEPELSLEMPGEDLGITWRLGAAAVVARPRADGAAAAGRRGGRGRRHRAGHRSRTDPAARHAAARPESTCCGPSTTPGPSATTCGAAAGWSSSAAGSSAPRSPPPRDISGWTSRSSRRPSSRWWSSSAPRWPRSSPACTPPMAPGWSAGSAWPAWSRRRATRRRSAGWSCWTGASCRPTSSWSGSAPGRSPPGSTAAVCSSLRATGASSATPPAPPAAPASWRSATAPPGTTRRSGGPVRVEHWTSAHERGPLAAATLLGLEPPRLRGGPAPYFWSDQYGRRIQFAGHARPGDEVLIEEGSPEEGSLLAVYRREGEPVAVLGIDRPRPFTRWRRALGTPGVAAAAAQH